MFQGSKQRDGGLLHVRRDARREPPGGRASTARRTRTAPTTSRPCPPANLETLLWLESDRLATLTDAMTKEKLDNQRDVVKNERRQGLENTPYGRWYKLVLENLYPAGHPYSWPVIGSHEDLTAASLEDVKEFFKTYYTPNNLSLVIAGDFDPAEAKRLVEKYFGADPAGAAARPPDARHPDARRARRSSRPPTACRRTASTWSGRRRRASRPGDADARPRLADPDRRPLLAAQQGARLRPPALHGRPGLPELVARSRAGSRSSRRRGPASR